MHAPAMEAVPQPLSDLQHLGSLPREVVVRILCIKDPGPQWQATNLSDHDTGIKVSLSEAECGLEGAGSPARARILSRPAPILRPMQLSRAARPQATRQAGPQLRVRVRTTGAPSPGDNLLASSVAQLLCPCKLRQSGGGTGSRPPLCIELSWPSNKPDPDLQRSTEESHRASTYEARGSRPSPPSSQDSICSQMPACSMGLPLPPDSKTRRRIIKCPGSELILRTQPWGHKLHNRDLSQVQEGARPTCSKWGSQVLE